MADAHALSSVLLGSGDATVDAQVVAEGLALDPEDVPAMVRDGEITCAFERGMDADEGRFRLTFWHGTRRFRVVVDTEGRILQRLRIDYGSPGRRTR